MDSARIIQTPLHAHAHAHTVLPPAQVCDPPNPNFSRAARLHLPAGRTPEARVLLRTPRLAHTVMV